MQTGTNTKHAMQTYDELLQQPYIATPEIVTYNNVGQTITSWIKQKRPQFPEMWLH